MLGLNTKTFAPNCPPVVDGATTLAADAVGAAAVAGIAGAAAKQAPAGIAGAQSTARGASARRAVFPHKGFLLPGSPLVICRYHSRGIARWKPAWMIVAGP